MLYLDFALAKTKDENRERLTEFSVGPKPFKPAMQNATVKGGPPILHDYQCNSTKICI